MAPYFFDFFPINTHIIFGDDNGQTSSCFKSVFQPQLKNQQVAIIRDKALMNKANVKVIRNIGDRV